MSAPEKVYVLFGHSGEYSDHTEWVIGAYLDEAHAKADAEALGVLARQARDDVRAVDIGDDDWWDKREAIVARLKQHDAESDVEADYFVAAVPVFAARRAVSERSR